MRQLFPTNEVKRRHDTCLLRKRLVISTKRKACYTNTIAKRKPEFPVPLHIYILYFSHRERYESNDFEDLVLGVSNIRRLETKLQCRHE